MFSEQNHPLLIAEKACKTIMNSFTPAELPPANKWHYHQSVFLYGMLRVWEATGNDAYFEYAKAYVDNLLDDEGNFLFARDELDSIQVGILLFPLYDATGHEKYLIAAKKLRNLLNTINKTSEGGYWHKDKYPYQMWLDGLFMAAPFMLMYSKYFQEPELIRDVFYQESLMRAHMKDPTTGLPFHAWDEIKVQPWSNKDTGCSPEFWGRSVGWYGTALIDILELLEGKNHGQKVFIEELQSFIPSIINFQDADSGLWHQVIDKGEQPDNWLESSCSSLFIYTIAKALKAGYINQSYKETITNAYDGLLQHMVKVEGDHLELSGICIGTSAGLYDYYVERPTSVNDLHGMGAFILACMALHDIS